MALGFGEVLSRYILYRCDTYRIWFIRMLQYDYVQHNYILYTVVCTARDVLLD